MMLAQPTQSAHGPTQAATWSPYDNNGGCDDQPFPGSNAGSVWGACVPRCLPV